MMVGLLLSSCSRPRDCQVSSPDGSLVVSFALSDSGVPHYAVSKGGEKCIEASVLGFRTAQADLSSGFVLTGVDNGSKDEVWETTWGEERYVRDHHNSLTAHLRHTSGILLDIEFRAFADGFAFRYAFPKQCVDSLVITDELTEYNFAAGADVWSIPWRTEYYEALWQRAPLNATDTACSPVTMELQGGGYVFLHEAALVDYPAQNFVFSDNSVSTYLTPLQNGVKANVATPFATPWRFMTIADDLRGLCASRIMLNLNEPCQIDDTSWIKPMKFIGIWWGMHLGSMTWHQGPKHGATTRNMIDYLDFAAQNGIDAVLAEGWNLGWEDWKHFDFTTPYSDWDMEAIARYADSVGVKIVGHNETGGNAADYETMLDSIYSYHRQHGIGVIKTGYVSPIITTVDGPQYNRSQAGVRHYRKVIDTAAKYHICIDNHEPVMPTGLQRTMPNLMTQEGVRGQEWNAWGKDGGSPCSHVCTLPFTRVLAGPVDYTPGVFNFSNPENPGTRVHSTLAGQLALFVVMYSPLQMACDLPENYLLHPQEFEFVQAVPCDWERSVLVDGSIGEYVCLARQRRDADDWYVGMITADAMTAKVPMSFLTDDADYMAKVYCDAEDADWQTNPYATRIYEKEVTSADTLVLPLAAGGGCAIEIIRCPDDAGLCPEILNK